MNRLYIVHTYTVKKKKKRVVIIYSGETGEEAVDPGNWSFCVVYYVS